MNLRPVEPRDMDFLADMLVEAAYPPWTDPKPTAAAALADPHAGPYLRSWGRLGDLAIIAEDDQGHIGAAWCRLFSATDPGYGFVADDVPELAIGVVAQRRGEGAGQRLLEALVEEVAALGWRALSLTVNVKNPVALHLYDRAGFVRVGGTDEQPIMLLQLARPSMA